MSRLTRREFLIASSAAALAGAGFPTFAATQTAGASRPRGGTLNVLINPEPPVLVSIFQTTGPALAVSSKVLEGLLAYDFDLSPKPQLATAWSVSPDGLKYTFKLRQNVRWHDGQPFTSADVAFSIDLLKTVHPRGRSTFANVTSVATPDTYTAVIELSKPAPFLIKALSAGESPIVPKHLYAGADPLTNPHNNAPIGTGPYRFKSWTRGANIVYERNPDYWDPGKPYIDALVYKVIPDAAARSAAFETGALDLGGENPVPLTDLPRLTQLPQMVVETRVIASLNRSPRSISTSITRSSRICVCGRPSRMRSTQRSCKRPWRTDTPTFHPRRSRRPRPITMRSLPPMRSTPPQQRNCSMQRAIRVAMEACASS